ncbi:MAG: MerR family transcriptional regulator [Bacteroidales bacterium]
MTEQKNQKKYSIKDLENITGIKAHTIRMWEKRYGIIKPKRTNTNIRYYSDKDLKILMNISTLNKNGIKISEIVHMDTKNMCDKIIELNGSTGIVDSQINALIISATELDQQQFDKTMSNCIVKRGIEKTFTTVIFPFLEKLGVMWQTGTITPVHEHYISNLIRQKLIVAIDNIDNQSNDKNETFILFLPENELHEINLLFNHYILKKAGYNVIYLGQTVPTADIIKISKDIKSEYLLTVITTGQSTNQLIKYIDNLSNSFSEKTIFITGPQVAEKEIPQFPNVITFSDYEDLKKQIDIISK